MLLLGDIFSDVRGKFRPLLPSRFLRLSTSLGVMDARKVGGNFLSFSSAVNFLFNELGYNEFLH